jgi:hypothetical protein
MTGVTKLVPIFLFIGSGAFAQNADDQAIRNYTLTMDKVVRYDAGARALESAMNRNPQIMVARQKMARQFAGTPRALEARLDRFPQIEVYFTREGLSRDDAALIPLALGNACLAGSQPQFAKALVYSEAQVKFCKDNQGALEKLRIFAPVRPTQLKR